MNTFPRGIHPSGKKELTQNIAISCMPTPKRVYIPLSQHIGAPAKAIVAVGDRALMGQKIGEAAGNISAAVFSSCSGTVVAIESRVTPTGKCEHIVIDNDELDEAMNLAPLDDPTPEQITERVAACGVVGMGGAGFPTAVKLRPKEKLDTLIIDAAECEPYITCDYRIMLEYTEQFLRGAMLLAKAVGISNIYIGIEDNKPEAVTCIENYIKANNLDIIVSVLPKKYPQGAEKQLIYAVTGKIVPTGRIPSAIGALVCNVHTALSTYFAVYQGVAAYRRVMTVTGGGIKNPTNIWVANGTLYKDIIAYAGGLSDKPTVKLLSGGPMMGISVLNDECATTKTSGCLLLMTSDEAFCGEPSACINCARCARACPMGLMPMYIDAYALVGDIKSALKYGAMNCIECGCCAYTCPAKRPIVQSIKLAKKKFKEGGLK